MPTARPATTLLAAAALAATAEAFTAPGRIHLSAIAPQRRCSQADIHAGLFDNLFGESEEQKRQKEEAWKAQQEMLARRRNPEKAAEYFAEVEQRRQDVAADGAELKQVQMGGGGGDRLEEWKRLREEGKVTASGQERDADSSRWGSEGLIAERIDEKLPYIDDGYVDESVPDVMEGLKKLFGGDEKK